MKMFKLNGQVYTKLWAVWPVRTTNQTLVWFDYYYVRVSKHQELVILDYEEFLKDSNFFSG